ncbi:MAG: hypothetical protein AAF907_18375, partial [Planctomycetota bacterium]
MPPGLAARLADLAPSSSEAGEAPVNPPRPAHKTAPKMAAAPAGMKPEKTSFDESLPEHLRKNTRGDWGWVPYAIVAVLAAVWIGSLLLDSDLWSPRTEIADTSATGLDPDAAAARIENPGGDAAADGAPESDGEPEPDANEAARIAAAEAEEANRLAGTLPIDPPPPEADSGEAPAGDPIASADSDPKMTDPGGEAVPGADAAATEPDETAPVEPPPPPAIRLTVEEGRGLFALDAERSGFYAVPAGEAVPNGVPLVVPGPLHATLRQADGPLTIELLGGTSAILSANKPENAMIGLSVADGRVRALHAAGSEATGDEASIMIGAGGAMWR